MAENPVTYGRLDEVLRQMGFSSHVVFVDVKTRVYKHQDTGALIAIAYFPQNDAVLPHHLNVVRATLKEYAIANPSNWPLISRPPVDGSRWLCSEWRLSADSAWGM